VNRKSKGFTLIELMFVLILLALMTRLAIPKASNLLGFNLRSAATEVASYLRSAREQAVMRHERLRVRFDLANGSYWAETLDEEPVIPLLTSQTDIDKAIQQLRERTEQDLPSEEEKLARDAARYKKMDTGSLKTAQLPQNIRFAGVFAGGKEGVVKEGSPWVEFAPGGFAPKTLVYVTNDSEEQYSILLESLTGRPRVIKGEVRPDEM